MPKLKLKKLKCVETEDFVAADEPYLVVDQNVVWGPGSLANGDTANLQSVDEIEFTGNVGVQLFDQDTGFLDPDDLLGGITIGSGQAGQGLKTASFTGDGANYVLSYEVLADPPPPPPPPPPVQFPIDIPTAQKSVGNTTAKVWAKLSKQPTQGLIELHVYCKKTGLNGTGFAYGQVALLDKDANTLFKSPILSKTKGANADPFNNPGVAEGQADADYTVSLDTLLKTKTAAVIVSATDNSGLPSDIDEFTELLKKVRDIVKIGGEIAADVAKIVVLFA